MSPNYKDFTILFIGSIGLLRGCVFIEQNSNQDSCYRFYLFKPVGPG